MAGRPRGIEDTAILRAAVEVISRAGPAGFTLAAVAGEVGLVAGTLAQRFGSKRGLLLALGAHTARETEALRARVRSAHPSALDALTALIVETMAPMATPESYAHHLAFLCMDLADPELHEQALAAQQAQTEAIRTLLTEAVDLGELRPGTDPEVLAGTVQAVATGAGLMWALDRDGTLDQRLRRELDAILAKETP
jgi:AcrR family transcriptional regulator